MARIQYRPSAQRRGFNPQQLSTEGISRMREESNRIIQGLQENRKAEARQREIDRQAMEDNAAYQERMIRENFEIEQQNLVNQQQQKLANIQGESKQAQIDATAATTILDSLVGFSTTLQKESARRTKQMIEDQTEIGRQAALAVDPQRLEEYIRAENARVDGTIAQMGEISANAVESNEDRLETIKNLAGIPGLSGYALQGALNEMAVQLYGDTLQSRLTNTDTTFVSSTGNQYTGAQASRDVKLSSELQQQTKRDVLKFLNITEPLQVRKGLEAIDKYNEAITTQVRERNLEDQEEEIRQKASLAERRDNFEGFTIAFQARRSAFGLKAAHDGLQALVADPDISLEEIKKVKIDGKVWYENWANRWEDGLSKRNQAITDNLRLERQLLTEEDKAWVRANLPSIQEAYNQNPTQAALLVKKRYLDKGMAVPEAIRSIETAAIAKNKAEIQATFEERQRYGILDLPFVNNIQDPVLQKKARAAYEQQQLARYGPETLGIKKGLKATARKLTKIDPNEEQGSATTFLVNARLESEYLKELKSTNDPLRALENVNQMVDRANAFDKSSPFYFETGLNNRLVFPNIQTSDREVQERNTYIDKKLISGGAAVAQQPYTLASQDEMDATYQSSLSGIIQYPPGVLRVADKLGLKPSEVYNAQRAANNAVSGSNKPLLTPSSAADLIDVAPPAMRKLFLSDVPEQINRGSAMLTGQLPRRASMGGSSFNVASVPKGYGPVIEQAAVQNNIPPEILAGLIDTESAFNPQAVSRSGAQGLAQFMPPTAAEFGVNVNDPVSSIDGAARYLRYLIDYFNGDMNLAIYAYNGGMGNIERYGGPIPGNRENEEYLQKVLTNSTKYR
jgi:soluble lytic murein transglycosylase-like protein